MKRMILLAVVLSVGCAVAGWRGRFDEQFAAASSRWTPLELSPIAWYKGDGNATDAMGNYDGTWAGTEAYADGPTGQAFDFDGSSYISASPSGTSITASMFIRCTTSGLDFLTVGNRFFRINNDNTIRLYFNAGARGVSLSGFAGLTSGAYTHLTISIVGNDTSFYQDGQYIGKVVDDSFSGYARVTLGQSRYSKFNGQLDDVLIFDRALTAEEIELLYNESINKDGAEW